MNSWIRNHLERYGTAPDGLIARAAALTPARQVSPLGRRPYDLRHVGVSLTLNAGVPATEVARRVGHGVAVLLKIHAQRKSRC